MLSSIAAIASGSSLTDSKKKRSAALDRLSDWAPDVFTLYDFMSPLDKLKVMMKTMRHGPSALRKEVAELERVSDVGSFEAIVEDFFLHNKQELSSMLDEVSSLDAPGMTSMKMMNSGVTPRLGGLIGRYSAGLAISPVFRELPHALRLLMPYWEVVEWENADGCRLNVAKPDGGHIATCVDDGIYLSIFDLKRGGAGLRINADTRYETAVHR